jgi:hypothetical protein
LLKLVPSSPEKAAESALKPLASAANVRSAEALCGEGVVAAAVLLGFRIGTLEARQGRNGPIS